jgi:hypothetical protein
MRKEKRMIRVSVQVRSGAARFSVAVQAESIARALQIVKRYNPGKDCQVVFPIDPETFFVGAGVARAGQVGKVAA